MYFLEYIHVLWDNESFLHFEQEYQFLVEYFLYWLLPLNEQDYNKLDSYINGLLSVLKSLESKEVEK